MWHDAMKSLRVDKLEKMIDNKLVINNIFNSSIDRVINYGFCLVKCVCLVVLIFQWAWS